MVVSSLDTLSSGSGSVSVSITINYKLTEWQSIFAEGSADEPFADSSFSVYGLSPSQPAGRRWRNALYNCQPLDQGIVLHFGRSDAWLWLVLLVGARLVLLQPFEEASFSLYVSSLELGRKEGTTWRFVQLKYCLWQYGGSPANFVNSERYIIGPELEWLPWAFTIFPSCWTQLEALVCQMLLDYYFALTLVWLSLCWRHSLELLPFGRDN